MKQLYLLVGPDGAIRYVGLTNNLEKRLEEHCTDRSWHAKRRWILELREAGLRPDIIGCGPATTAMETRWIRTLSKRCELFNISGGDVSWAKGTAPKGLHVSVYEALVGRLLGENEPVRELEELRRGKD